ncbi:MAG: SEC-C domain-containing protein [Nitrososphaerota archaeon]|nr:SEC-C domain-containing protein [Nitrososphaerota archaeon]
MNAEERGLGSLAGDAFDERSSRRLSGRNDPCPCGSRRKYKNCCLPLQQERMRWAPLEDRVRDLIEEFVHDGRFEDERRRASSLFGFDGDNDNNGDKTNLTGGRLFYDWYIHDYFLPQEGRSLIGLLEEKMAGTGPSSSGVKDEQTKATLSSWASSTFSFLEVLDVRKGTGFRVRDLFRGSEYFVWDVSGSRSLSKYDILYSRPYAVGKIMRLASGVVVLPQRLKPQVEEYVKAARAAGNYGTIDEYLRSQSIQIIWYLRTLLTKPPAFLTSEGDIVLFASCEYTLSDPKRALKILDSSEEFVDVGEEEGALRYDWVRKADGEGREEMNGGSRREDDARTVTGESAWNEPFQLQTWLTDADSGERFIVLGNLSLRNTRLELSCSSDRRLQSCKALVERVMGWLIVEQSEDRYVETASIAAKEDELKGEGRDDSDGEDEIPPQVERKIEKELFDDYYSEWLRMKVPALGNMTPSEASKTAEGRRKLEELLKMAENEAERSGGKLKPPVAKLRKVLGLTSAAS